LINGGNKWLDWSSGVLIANTGHGRDEIINTIRNLLDNKLLATYVFVHEKRAELTKMLQKISPEPVNYLCFFSALAVKLLKIVLNWQKHMHWINMDLKKNI